MASDFVCKSCGVPFSEHLGVEGLCRELQEARKMLKVLQWGNLESPVPICPFCGNPGFKGHTRECRLAKMING